MNSANYLTFTRCFHHYNLRSCATICVEFRSNCNFYFDTSRNLKPHNPLYIQKLIFKDARSKFRLFSTTSDKDFLREQKNKVKSELKYYIKQNKEKFRDTEQRIKEKSSILLKDIKETRDRVKEKVEEVIEKENVYTVPNLLCVTRILISPYLGMLIVQANFNFALAILGFAAVTDLLDGWIARTWESQSSKMGSFLDPMADKVLIATLFLTLTYADLIPIALTSIIIGRDLILILAGFVIRYRSLPPPRTLSRYFDVSHATAQLAPTFISKINTAIQLVLVGSTLAAPVFQYVGHPLLESLWYITGTTTIAAGLSYILSKDTYRYLQKYKPK